MAKSWLYFSVFLAFVCGAIACPSIVQGQTVSTSGTTSDVFAEISSAFSGGQAVQSIQLSGNVTLQAGSLHDTGSATLTASADGTWKSQFTFSQIGQRTESRTATEGQRDCEWAGADGVIHEGTGGCWTALVWFLPQISFQPSLIPATLISSDQGNTQTSAGTRRVVASQLILGSKEASTSASTMIQKQSSTVLSLDPTALIPLSLDFKQPSDSGTAQIAVKVRYSAYKSLSGVFIPAHIERYLNGGLELTIDITQASLN